MSDLGRRSIRWESVAATYPGPPPIVALEPTDIVVRSGEYTVITGPSGSGKSTFLSILGLLEDPTSGEMWIDGHSLADASARELSYLRSTYFGFVFQRFHLLPSLSALENVELALMYGEDADRHERLTRARGALERVGLVDRCHHRPPLLSGGEQQRVAIARAIVRKQKFVLADEPTGNLDSKTSQTILELLRDLVSDGVGVVCVTHDKDVAAQADRCLLMTDGRLTDSNS